MTSLAPNPLALTAHAKARARIHMKRGAERPKDRPRTTVAVIRAIGQSRRPQQSVLLEFPPPSTQLPELRMTSEADHQGKGGLFGGEISGIQDTVAS